MQNEIKKYQVHHPLLRNYIRFFWEFRAENIQLNHKLIPQRNINLRFNLSETPHFLFQNGSEHLLENVYFSGLQDQFVNAHLKLEGNVNTIGVCFVPNGFYPFFKIPVSEFKNQWFGADQVGFKLLNSIFNRLVEANDIKSRLTILENGLLSLLSIGESDFQNFQKIFYSLKIAKNSNYINEFCIQNSIGIRKLERMYNKYLGVPASTYGKLNRFHGSLNQLLYADFSKLSDLAYDNGYFDQMHFIKDFKRFTGNSPKNFLNQNDSILQIGKLT